MHHLHLAQRPLASVFFSLFGTFTPVVRAELLDPVTVTATRTAAPASRTAASVSIITDTDLEKQQAIDIKDALRYEPGVTVRRAPYRPSSVTTAGGRDNNSSINIRGLEGNRVLLMEDGIRLPGSFSFGPLEAGRGDYADLGALQRIEILRGPASALYGSDGLTGAVNFITKNPQDLLAIYGGKTYFSLRPIYDSTDRSFGATVQAAGGSDTIQAMLIADGKRGHETGNKGSNSATGVSRTTPNPQDIHSQNLLGKLVVKPGVRDTFRFTAATVRQRISTNVLSAIDPLIVLSLNGNDRLERNRYSLDYAFQDETARFFQTVHGQLYYQKASQDQESFETRGPSASRARDSTYSERAIGGSAFAESSFRTGILMHKLLVGIDGSTTHVKSLRAGTAPGAGEAAFPNKPFPDTSYILLGAFAQNQISYGALTITPGLRFDSYRLGAQAGDPLYLGNPVSSRNHALSPRLTMLYEASPALIPYAQYAHGFRAPSPDQVNNSFANPLRHYRSIGNPDLKPETSDTIEAGLRGRLGTRLGPLRYSTAIFAGRYHDFISRQTIGGRGTVADPLVFQYVNYAKSRIHGIEGRLDWHLPHGFSVKTAMAFTKGSVDNEGGSSQPLDTIDPFSAVFGLRYEPGERWFAQADLLFQAAKKASDITSGSCSFSGRSSATCFAPPSSFVVDLRGGYRFSRHVIGYIGVSNLFDRRYWNWSDVRGITESSPVKHAYTAPGRNVSVSMKIDF